MPHFILQKTPKKTKHATTKKQTPREAAPAFGCPAAGSVDTCPSDPGADSTSNFMQYTDDACMSAFSQGQVARMAALWKQYRASASAAADGVAAEAGVAEGEAVAPAAASNDQQQPESGRSGSSSPDEPQQPQRRRRRVARGG